MRYLVFSLGLMVCGCDKQNFSAPPLPDNLKKEPPYDFAEQRYPRDLAAGGEDLSVTEDNRDLAAVEHDMTIVKPDLLKPIDMTEGRDQQ